MSRPTFDNTISMGNILQVITLLLALWGLGTKIEARLTMLETKIEPLWHDYTDRITNTRGVP